MLKPQLNQKLLAVIFTLIGILGIGLECTIADSGATEHEDAVVLAELPHSLSQAYLRMFTDTVQFALEHEPAWARNLQVAALWRADLVDLPDYCFLGENRRCLIEGATDRKLLLDVFGKAIPPDAPGWGDGAGIERKTVISGTVELMALLLASNIDTKYQSIQSTDERGAETPPELVYTKIAAMGRYAQEQWLNLEPVDDGRPANVGFLVLWRPSSDKEYLSIALARRPIQSNTKGTVPTALGLVSLNDVADYLSDSQAQERIRRILVPPGRMGGPSLYLMGETNRARELISENQLEQAIAILEVVRRESENSRFNQYLEELLRETRPQSRY